MITATRPCNCDEAKVERGHPKSAPVAERKWATDEELSSVAKAAHNCEYVRWRNSKLGQAEATAVRMAKQETLGQEFIKPKFDAIVSRLFHAEMSRLCSSAPLGTDWRP